MLGPDHPETLRSSRDLARAYRAVGRLNAALALSTGTLADYERVLGPVHPDTLTARLNLASAYREMGRLDEAIALVTRTLADRERVLGPDHPNTFSARLNLADTYQAMGRLDESIALLTGTLAHSSEPWASTTRTLSPLATALRSPTGWLADWRRPLICTPASSTTGSGCSVRNTRTLG